MSGYKSGLIALLLLMGCTTTSSQIKKESILQHNIAVKYIRLDLWQDAKLHLLKALELAPQEASIYNSLGVVYEYFNLNDKAKEVYQKAVSLAPDIPVYQKNLNSFERECLNSTQTTTLEKETPSHIKISTVKIPIKRILESKIKIDKINRVALFSFSKNEDDKNAIKISQMLSQVFKMNVLEENPFYILEDYEIKDLTQEEPISQQDIENSSKRMLLYKILSIDGLFVLKINEFKDRRYKKSELKNYYSEEKKEFIYYYQPYIERNIEINMSISFFEATTDRLLWDKEYKDNLSNTYVGDDEENIRLFDKQLFKDFINKCVEDFIIDISPQEKVYERILVIENQK
ncbi:MAG: hypothetical protein AB1422_18140 [bacterium]